MVTISLFLCITLGYRCPRLEDPENGYVSVQGNIASYYCHSYYTLVGEHYRVCYRGLWLSKAPRCVAGEFYELSRMDITVVRRPNNKQTGIYQ
jgi:hypothetical protein